MRLSRGRFLTDADYTSDVTRCVVNEAFARRYLGEDPLGPFPNGGHIRALGATPSHVVRGVMTQGLGLAITGGVAGLGAAALAARFMT